ncbi:tetratricopeptide repeat protein [candidate division KSB1 bacterium]|nr:tetratricopeptide repeat protein [candidate division KSB1 bacterium]
MAARPEKHLWSQTFNRDLVDVLALHSEVARQIASEIQIKVTQDEETRLQSEVAVNSEAYENYLLGRHYLRMGGETLWQAIEYFERAIALDSTFAPGYAGLALAYSDLGGTYNIIAPEDSWPKVREYAAKALALNEGLAEAYTALALVKQYYDWDWVGAEKEFKHAMELNPNSLEVLEFYLVFLGDGGRHDDAVTLYEKIIRLDPNSKSHPIWVVYYSGRVEEAIQLMLIESKSQPEKAILHWHLATWYTEAGKYDDAIEHLKIQIPLMKGDEVDEVALLGNLYGRIGHRAQALEMLERLDELMRQGKYVSPALKAWVYSGLNDRDEAILWLTKGYETRAHRMGLDIIWVKYVFEPIADDPRFKDLLRKMNLEPW